MSPTQALRLAARAALALESALRAHPDLLDKAHTHDREALEDFAREWQALDRVAEEATNTGGPIHHASRSLASILAAEGESTTGLMLKAGAEILRLREFCKELLGPDGVRDETYPR